jgi:hypothetical protein
MLRGKVSGYSRWTDDASYGPHQEADTTKCLHCQRIIEVPARANPNDVHGWCYSCDGAICVRCQKLMDIGNPCVHWAKALELAMRRADMLRDIGL